jgi:UPF0755 protein
VSSSAKLPEATPPLPVTAKPPIAWRGWANRLFLVLLVVGALFGAGRAAWFNVSSRPGPLGEPRNIVIPHGGLTQTADALAEAGAIDDRLSFRLVAFATSRHGALHAGEFAFPAHASVNDLLAILCTARPVQHHVTIPEGLTAKQIALVLERADAAGGGAAAPAEGSVLPETYAYELGTPRDVILQRAHAAMEKALANAWATRAPDLPLATPQEALILASIVERETARPEERPLVAAVFLNRLRAGMKLQSDPTVVYAASDGLGTLDHPITRAELDRDSPYNTYRIAGLPPGPISSPGLASLAAATHPAASDDLYFVADGTGGHSFSRTLDDHQRNVAKWRSLGH